MHIAVTDTQCFIYAMPFFSVSFVHMFFDVSLTLVPAHDRCEAGDLEEGLDHSVCRVPIERVDCSSRSSTG